MLLFHNPSDKTQFHVTLLIHRDFFLCQIYKAADELPQNLFLDQPTYKHGMWQRPFITSTKQGQVIHLVLMPSKENYYNASFYSGFRASYIVKKSNVPL